MSDATVKMEWETAALKKYELIISKIPLFHRNIAKVVVDKKALSNARDRGSELIEESDIVSAFFSEVPKAFYSLMIRLFDEVGFVYDEQESKNQG